MLERLSPLGADYCSISAAPSFKVGRVVIRRVADVLNGLCGDAKGVFPAPVVKSAPDRRMSQSTAEIGSNAGCDARCLLSCWLKSASASFQLNIRTIALALYGTKSLKTSTAGVNAKNS